MTNSKQIFPFDIEKIRADFPILHQDHHEGVPLVFLDNSDWKNHPSTSKGTTCEETLILE